MKNPRKIQFAARVAVLGLAAFGLTVLSANFAWAGAKKTPFTVQEVITNVDWGTMLTDGTNIFLAGGVMVAEEIATDPRVSGASIATMDLVFDATMAGPMWGSILYTNAGGWWEGYWQGTRTAYLDAGGNPHARSEIRATAIGGGGYEGLVARWEYMGVDAQQTGLFDGSGYIVEAKGGPGDRPFKLKAARTDWIELHPCMVIDPVTMQPTGETAMIGTENIVSEVGVATHLGRYSNRGSALVNPTNGAVSAAGTAKAANGDLLFWVATGTTDVATGVVNAHVHFAGGTGRFEAAVGGCESGAVHTTLTPIEPPFVFEATGTYSARGAIRY